jgi:uncharacterized membrane protein
MEHRHLDGPAEQFSAALGWFSLALGVTELAAPKSVARLTGLNEEIATPVVRALGVREIAHGLSILAMPGRPGPVWSRVAGDAIDIAVVASAIGSDESDRGRVSGTIAALAGVSALDLLCARQLSRNESGRDDWKQHGVRVVQVTTINRPIEDVYQFWRNFQNFPRFMRHLISVEQISDSISRWRAKGPAGITVEWQAELIEAREHEWIAWRSLEGSDVRNSGSVRFQRAPGARGTEVRVQLHYRPPAGSLGRGIAFLFGEEPSQQIKEDLHRCKQLLETGVIALSEGLGLWRPAQPPADPQKFKELAGVHE